MKVKLENQKYDTLLLPIEWRYSAALLGLKRFFDFIERDEGLKLYDKTSVYERSSYSVYEQIGGYMEGILYNQDDITEGRYLRFCEFFFGDDMQHIKVERFLNKEEFTEDDISYVNGLLTGQAANTVLKNVFGKVKFNGSNTEEILGLIDNNRENIIKETFRYKPSMYRNFSNTNKLLSKSNPHCRLLGYDLDEGRKSKSIAYRFDNDTFIAQDIEEFDFIPFAFTKSYEAFFVNNNCSVYDLEHINDVIKDIMEKKAEIIDNREVREGSRTKLVKGMIKANDFMEYDVEIISKKIDLEMFDTFFVRKGVLATLKDVYEKSNLRFIYKYGYNYYLDVEETVIDCCINNIHLDGLLERLLAISKDREQYNLKFIIQNLIMINVKWKGDLEVMDSINRAKSAGYRIKEKMKTKLKDKNETKCRTYYNKLVNAIIAHDKDRVLEIMLQLSAYVEESIGIMIDIMEKDEWAHIAEAFTIGLMPNNGEKKSVEENN